LLYTGLQIRAAREIAQAQYVMDYFTLLQDYNDLHQQLVRGAWSQPGTGPETNDEWFRIERYMGLLEQLDVFIETGIMTENVVDRNYSHRIHAIIRNETIRQTELVQQQYRWTAFIRLEERLKRMPVYSALEK
jgi:hypothetical protein